MPGSILNADTGFPQFAEDESSEQKLDKVMNYLYMLLEQLRYTLNNLDSDNFNEAGLKEIEDGISWPLRQSFENELVKTNASIDLWANEMEAGFRTVAEWQNETSSSLVKIEGKANANGASISSLTKIQNETVESLAAIEQESTAQKASIEQLTQFRKDVEGGNIESLTSIKQQSDENASQIALIAQWQKTVEDGTISSIANINAKADENSADILLLAQWKAAVDGELDDLTTSTALIKATADENEAAIESLTQFQKTVENGTISSISSVKQTADANKSTLNAIAQWQKTVENGTISSISSVNVKADNNAASITELNTWKSNANTSITAVQSLASQNEAKITSLTNWKNTAEDDIEGLVASLAIIEQTVGENGASISQIVSAVGRDGEVNAASIVAAVNAAGSSVKIDADHLDVDAIAIFKNTADGEGVTTINGDDIVLVADPYGDSISGLTFYKWRYTDDTEEDHTLDSMFRIRTIDNESDDENYARYAAQIQTLTANEDDTKYHVALKLLSAGSMSMESDYAIYMYADTYMTLEAYDNVRVRANRSYSAFTGDNVSADDYVFCTNGIYMDGVRVVNPAYEFTASGIYYNGELVVATP